MTEIDSAELAKILSLIFFVLAGLIQQLYIFKLRKEYNNITEEKDIYLKLIGTYKSLIRRMLEDNRSL